MLMSTGQKSEIKEVGVFTPKMEKRDVLSQGDVGYIVSNIKDTDEIKTGDTITLAAKPAQVMLPGYKEVRPMVFCGLYPIESSDYEKLKAALGRLRLNDSAFVYQQESSVALGFGFRCGFLGLLHMEIIQERIRREHDVEIISTYPSVIYKVVKHGGATIEVDNPVNLPDPGTIEQILEPTLRASIHIPNDSMGDMLALVMEKRGIVEHTHTLDSTRVMLSCILPLNEILVDFNDRLKSVTHGYGSMDYELGEYRSGRPCQDGDPGQRRPGRRVREHHPPGQGGGPRAASSARGSRRSSRRRCSGSPSRRPSAARSSRARACARCART